MNLSRTHAFLVVGTSAKLVREVLLALKAEGNSTACVIGGPGLRELRWTWLCRDCHLINVDRPELPSDDETFVQLVRQHAARLPGLVLLAADVEGAKLIDRTRPALPVAVAPQAGPALLDLLNDKWRFYQWCTSHGLRMPRTVQIHDKASVCFEALEAALGLPMVVKPADQAGSAGVLLIRSKAAFDQLVRQNAGYDFGHLIAQQYIEGSDFCFNLLAVDGELHAHSLQRRDAHQVRFTCVPELEHMGRMLARLAHYSGPMCIDARLEPASGRIFLIESNPRFWASLNASTWCGLNFVTTAAALATGRLPARQALSSGCFNERHPLLRPKAWLGALLLPGPRGRLLRASLTDLPMLARIARHQAKKLSARRQRGARAGRALEGNFSSPDDGPTRLRP